MSPLCTLATTNFELDKVTVFPNPTKEIISIRFNGNNENELEVSITNMLGQILFEDKNIKLNNANEFQLDVSDFQLGTYLVSIKSSSRIIQTKIIKN